MNELVAIVLIVVVCCGIFFAWLFSMAACPDQMINWLSGTANNTTCSTSYESKELIAREERQEDPNPPTNGNADQSTTQNPPSIFHQLSSIARRSNSKKLSVVPEQDEQQTVTSISQILFPLRHQSSQESNNDATTNAIAQLEARFVPMHDDIPEAVVVLNGNSQCVVDQDTQSQVEHLAPRYHYSAPAIHVA
ncbi:hypothetical protein M3Y96_00593500 [Aphelenchoides besseyi]|nr:hypothetical protein M3Y96_00593500 [Aphelenchoides besseyi]